MKSWKVFLDITGFYPKMLAHAAETKGDNLDISCRNNTDVSIQHGIPACSGGYDREADAAELSFLQ